MTSRTGAKKLARNSLGNMTESIEHGITDVHCFKVLDYIPNDVQITGGRIIIGTTHNRVTVETPRALEKKHGSMYIRASVPCMEAEASFNTVRTKAEIRAMIKDVAAYVDYDPEKAYFRFLTLTTKDKDGKEIVGRFMKSTKDIPDKEDLRRKTNILGLKEGKGHVAELLKKVTAKAYLCSKTTVPIEIVTCKMLTKGELK